MASQNNSNYQSGLRFGGDERILVIDWKLLFKRLQKRFTLLFRSARHRASQTEYTPPAWAKQFRFGWFRLGLIVIALFVFTQKQVDFTVSVGKMGVAATSDVSRSASGVALEQVKKSPEVAGSQLSVMPGLSTTTKSNWSVDQYDEVSVSAYVGRFSRVAQTEEDKFSIPAAAKLAIAILESEAGQSPKTREYNNHFGSTTANGFYANAWANWRAHSELIEREYSDLKAYAGSVENWISMLARSSYTSDPDYDTKLLAIVKRFGLE